MILDKEWRIDAAQPLMDAIGQMVGVTSVVAGPVDQTYVIRSQISRELRQKLFDALD